MEANARKSSGRPKFLILKIMSNGVYGKEDLRVRGIREMTVKPSV